MRTRLLWIALLVAVIAPVAAFAGSQIETARPFQRELAAVRQATAKYHNVNAAIADGYEPTTVCAASPEGAMGYHYVNPKLASDLTSDALHPEVLLYAPSKDGLKLVAVEYFQADAGQARPTILDQPFNGPMAGHEPGMPTHYDLHLWIWQDNPSGLFAPWNPAITC